jgi:hypothetical protein
MCEQAGLAQLVERFSCKEDVVGSNPTPGSRRTGFNLPATNATGENGSDAASQGDRAWRGTGGAGANRLASRPFC